jgi:hypothetical protein
VHIKVPFGLHAYEDYSKPVNAQRLINFFSAPQPPDSKNNPVLYPTPGQTLFVTVGNGPIHGMHVFDGKMYVVSGTNLYSVTSSGTTANLGTISGNERCSIEDNGFEICIVNGNYGYIYNAISGLQKITATAFYSTNRVAYLQGRFLFPKTNSNEFFASAYQDGTTYDALDFQVDLTDPSNLISLIAHHGEVWVFTENGIEIWTYNYNESSFPFQRVNGAYIEEGCAAAHTPVVLENILYWLSGELGIYRAAAYTPQRISTQAIERAIRSYSRIDDAFAYGFIEEGHYFYEITFPTANESWRYDVNTGLWHQPQTGSSGRYCANAHSFFNKKNYVGDYRNGNIYELSMSTYSDNGNTIYRTATTPQIHSGRLRAVMDHLEIDIESGVGLTTGQGSDPQIMLRYSDDGGFNWSNQRWLTMGEIGEYLKRVRFHNLGMFYQRMFEITISDAIKPVVIDAFADVEVEDAA